MIVDSLFSYLMAQSTVTALCPASIFPQVTPQDATYPAVTFSLDGDDRDLLLDEIGPLKSAMVSLDTYDPDHAKAHELADILETALAGYRGVFGSKTAEHIRLERKFDLFESDSKLYRVSQQFLIAYY